MAVNAASAQFSASYGSVSVKNRPVKEDISLENAVIIKDAFQVLDKKPEDFWDVTETTAEDGTITRTVSGKTAFIGPYNHGRTAFSVSLTFHPDTYEGGELGARADLLAAAYEAEKAAWRSAHSGAEQDEGLQHLDVVYEQQKTEISASFSSMVGGYLESCEPTGQQEQKVYDSIQALFASYEHKYQAVIGRTPQTEWMANNLYASALNLQKLGESFPMSGNGIKGLYSLQELEAAAMRVSRGFSVIG